MAERTAIRFDQVTFSFGGPPVLEDINFAIAEGEFAAIIGPNGGGKTTMLKLMLGLLETQRGFVRIFGLKPCRSTRDWTPSSP